MKLFFSLLVIGVLTISADGCGKKKATNGVYKARLEIKAICRNYTIKLLEGNIDTSLISTNWTDESTNKSYTNVFGLSNPCNLPDSIQQGDEFYFSIDTTKQEECIVCMAYYPTPPKKIMIKVVEGK